MAPRPDLRTRPAAPAGAIADLARAGGSRRLERDGARRGRRRAGAWCRCGASTATQAAGGTRLRPAPPTRCRRAWSGSNCRSTTPALALPRPGPAVSLRRPHAARHGRPVRPARRRQPRPAALAGPRPVGARRARRCSMAPSRSRRAAGTLPADYPFVRVEGDGVHEIAVGPVHAGIIEPGHFRFSVVGEKVLRLEAAPGLRAQGHRAALHRTAAAGGAPAGRPRLGRLDRGLCLGLLHGARIGLAAARCRSAPQWLRALMLERERVANHLGDLGALGNDAALAFGLAQFSRLREDWQRLSQRGLRPPLHDGRRRAGRRRGRPAAAAARRLRRQCDDSSARSARCGRSTTSTRACRTAS